MLEYLLKILSLICVSAALVVSGCSSVEEKPVDDKDAVKVVETAPADVETPGAQKKSDVATPVPEGDSPAEKASPEPAESSAEVLEPAVAEQQALTLEPIPEQKEELDAAIDSTSPESKASGVAKQDVQVAIAAPAIEKKDTPVSTGPNHFVITVYKKDTGHPKFGQGHEMGFLINDMPGGEVVVERGKTYQFEVSTDPKHDVYISKKEIGWGASPLSKGVQGAYIYDGIMTFNPDDSTPGEVFYSCRNHPYMGGKIHVVNPGETVEITTTQKSATAATSQKTQTNISVAMVNQKLMFADMLLMSSGAKRVNASSNSDAKAMQQKAEQLVTEAKGQLKKGDNQVAYNNAEEALVLIRDAANMVPDEDQVELLKDQYKELLGSLENFEKSHQESYKRVVKSNGEAVAVDYDKKQVNTLKNRAAELAGKGDYVKANQDLETAQRMVTVAIQKMLDSKTIVYDLNFETPQEEYEYELKRFGGYEELIPVAVREKKPSEGAKKLMETYLKKGQDMRDSAIAKADAGEYASAIPVLQNATKEVRRALRMVGVMQ